jgi:DNA-binding transcriptional LysR family regulator
MNMALSPLPPLHTLVAFEATVRLGSFTRAGEELNLTQSAVSRQIATLEQSLGRTLMLHQHSRLLLTTAGERYLHRVRYLLEECADATARVMKHAGENEINLACSSGIAQFWIPERLSAFRQAYPEIRFNLIMRDSISTLSSFEFDVGMYYLKQSNIIHFDTIRLFDEEIFPVCSPQYLTDGQSFTPEALSQKTLLVLEDAQRQWIGWHEWLDLNGLPPMNLSNTLRVNHYPPLIELAIQGVGIALAWKRIIDRPLKQGSLVRACAASAQQGGGFYLVTPQ